MDFPDRYGRVKDIRDFCFKAQLVSYEQYRALAEGFNYKMWDWYTGMLVWKNQNPWTALRGSFYDYYLDYNGGYFGYKHGAEPIHIQLNLNDSVVCVLNQTAGKISSVKASVLLYDMHGKLLSEKNDPVTLDAHQLKLLSKVILPVNTDQIFFLKLLLKDGDKTLDENLYWLSNKKHSYEKLNKLEKVSASVMVKRGVNGHAAIEISNPGAETAFFIRLKVLNSNNELVLPSFFTENYFTLLPGDAKKVELDFSATGDKINHSDLRLVVEGWNVETEEIKF